MYAQLCLTPCDLMDFNPPGSFLFLEFSRQEYWSGLPFPTPKYPPDSGIEPASSALAGGFFTPEPPGCGRSQKTDYSLPYVCCRRVAKSRVTFCNPMDCSPPGSSADAIDGPVCCSEEGGILDPASLGFCDWWNW